MNSMSLSSFGGLTILCEEERHLSIASQLASCITDRRRKYLVHHSLEEIILTRIFQICLGYEDVNDCDRNRQEPMMKLAVGSEDLDKDICSLPFPSRCSRRRWSLSIPSIIQCTRNSPMH